MFFVTADTCQRIFSTLDRTAYTRILWRQIKPIVLGVIPYAPDTPAVRSIIKEVTGVYCSVVRKFPMVLNSLTKRSHFH